MSQLQISSAVPTAIEPPPLGQDVDYTGNARAGGKPVDSGRVGSAAFTRCTAAAPTSATVLPLDPPAVPGDEIDSGHRKRIAPVAGIIILTLDAADPGARFAGEDDTADKVKGIIDVHFGRAGSAADTESSTQEILLLQGAVNRGHLGMSSAAPAELADTASETATKRDTVVAVEQGGTTPGRAGTGVAPGLIDRIDARLEALLARVGAAASNGTIDDGVLAQLRSELSAIMHDLAIAGSGAASDSRLSGLIGQAAVLETMIDWAAVAVSVNRSGAAAIGTPALYGALAMTDRQLVRLETFAQSAHAENIRVSGPGGSAKVPFGTADETGGKAKDGAAVGVASAGSLANLTKALAGMRLDLAELFVFVEAMATLRKAYATARQAESEAKQAAIACAKTALMNQAIAKFVGSLVQAVVQIGAAVYSLRSIAAFTKAAGNTGQRTLKVDMLAPKTPAVPSTPAPGTSAAAVPGGYSARVTGSKTFSGGEQQVNVKLTRSGKGAEAGKSDSAKKNNEVREPGEANETMITNTRVNELNNLMTRLNLQSQIANGVGTALKAIVDLVADLYNAEHMVWTARAELCSYRYDVLREAASNALENQIRMQSGLSTLIGSESATAMMLIAPRA